MQILQDLHNVQFCGNLKFHENCRFLNRVFAKFWDRSGAEVCISCNYLLAKFHLRQPRTSPRKKCKNWKFAKKTNLLNCKFVASAGRGASKITSWRPDPNGLLGPMAWSECAGSVTLCSVGCESVWIWRLRDQRCLLMRGLGAFARRR